MRVTNTMLINQMLRDLYNNNQRAMRAQNQLSTGRIVNSPTDDALVADDVISLGTLIDRAGQYLRNGATGSSYLGITESSLGDAGTLATSARTLAVQMANGTVTASMRSGGAVEINQILEQVVELGNRRFRDRYVFGGFQTSRPPFELTADGVLYRGDMGRIALALSDYANNDINVTGSDAFGAFDARVLGSVDLDPVLNFAADGTKLSQLNAGRGVSLGTIRVSYGALTADVDLSAAESVADVADMISAATGGAVTVTAAAGGHALQVNGPAPLVVGDLNGGRTAADLGIAGAGAGAIVGSDVDPLLTGLTRLADLRNGLGAPLDTASGFTITNGSGSVTVTAAELAGSVQDLLAFLNSSPANVYAEISGDGRSLNVYSRLNGPTMVIAENGGSTAADLGVATAGVRADNLFTVLIDLRDALSANDQAAVDAAISPLDAALDRLLRARGEVGARMQRFETTNNRQEDQRYNLTKLLSEANDVDYSQAVLEFQNLRNVLEASLRMAAQVIPMSLADFL